MSETKSQENFGPTLEALLEHKEWLRRLARGLVFDDSQADDVVQQVFLSALKYRPSADRDMRPWLKVVATAVAKKIGRSEVRRIRREKKTAREDLLPFEETIAKFESDDTYRQLGEFLKSLEDPYRTILLLHYFQKIPLDEVGKRLGLSRSTVRNRYKRGIELLRARLDSRYGDRTAWGMLLLPMASLEPSSLVPAARKSAWKSSLGVAALVLIVPASILLTAAITASGDERSETTNAVGLASLQEEPGRSPSPRSPVISGSSAPANRDGALDENAGYSSSLVKPKSETPPNVSWKFEVDPETGIPTGMKLPSGAKPIPGSVVEDPVTPNEEESGPKPKKTPGKIHKRTVGTGITKTQ